MSLVHSGVASLHNADVCRALDHKLRYLARALKSWNAGRVGSIRMQLAVARVVIRELDLAQEHRQLSGDKVLLRCDLKATTLGLSALNRSLARQRARNRFLREGDACTRFFHIQACHRRRKNYISAVHHDGQVFTEEEAKSEIVYEYYHQILGRPFTRQHTIDLHQLQLPRLDLSDLALPFTADEIARTVKDTPSDRSPGPDWFTGAFYKACWEISPIVVPVAQCKAVAGGVAKGGLKERIRFCGMAFPTPGS